MPRQPRRDQERARLRWTTAPLEPWLFPGPWFLAQFGMLPNLMVGQVHHVVGNPADTFLSAADGSWCEVNGEVDANGTRRVFEGGPTSLWRIFEDAYEQWQAAGKPGWSRFGLTVTAEHHVVWLDEPNSDLQWSFTA